MINPHLNSTDDQKDMADGTVNFEELSHTYLDYLRDRALFVSAVSERTDITMIYKDTQTTGEESYTRPVVIIRTQDAMSWYNQTVNKFSATIDKLVDADPYTYSPKSPRLKKPEDVKTLIQRISLHEQTAISSRTEPVSAMRNRLNRAIRKAQRDFKVTFSAEDKERIIAAQDDMKLLEKYDSNLVLRRRTPSSTDASVNVWYSRNSKPERFRIAYTGMAFYVPLEKDAVFVNGSESLYLPAGKESATKIHQHEAKELAETAFFVAYAPRQSEALGGKERANPIRDAFDNGLIKPIPFKTQGTSTVYVESEIEAFRKSVEASQDRD